MTPEQLSTLRAAVLADSALSAVGRNDTELARLLNLPGTFYVWNSTTPADQIADAILWDRLTPLGAVDATTEQTNRFLLCQTKQMNLQILLQGRDNIGTGKANLRAGLSDALQNVPSGAGGALQDAGWIGAGRVKATIMRLATRAETFFATGTGTSGTPGSLVFEGQISINDIGEMWNQE